MLKLIHKLVVNGMFYYILFYLDNISFKLLASIGLLALFITETETTIINRIKQLEKICKEKK